MLVLINEQENIGLGVVKETKNGTIYFTPEAAHAAYKQFKENGVKELANKWRDKIDERVYNAMMSLSV